MNTIVVIKQFKDYYDISSEELIIKYFLTKIEEDIQIGEAFKFEGKYYSPCVKRLSENLIIVRQFTLKEDIEDLYSENEVTCPYCGYQSGDSVEYPNDGEEKCSQCGGKYNYSRDVDVSYSSNPIQSKDIKEIRGNK